MAARPRTRRQEASANRIGSVVTVSPTALSPHVDTPTDIRIARLQQQCDRLRKDAIYAEDIFVQMLAEEDEYGRKLAAALLGTNIGATKFPLDEWVDLTVSAIEGLRLNIHNLQGEIRMLEGKLQAAEEARQPQ